MKSIATMSLIVAALVGCGKEVGDTVAETQEQIGKNLVGTYSSECHRGGANTAPSHRHTLKLEGEKFAHETITYNDPDCTEANRESSEVYSGSYVLAHTHKAVYDSVLLTYDLPYSVAYYYDDVVNAKNAQLANKLAALLREQARLIEQESANPSHDPRVQADINELNDEVKAVKELPNFEKGKAQVINQKAARGLARGGEQGMQQVASILNSRASTTYQLAGHILFVHRLNGENLELTRN